MREKEFEIHIVDEKSNTFDAENNMFGKGDEYIIPLYQRAYAWEDKQLIQLIEDIKDIADDENYYIGTLIVSKQKNKFEVIDGQQRLTSLYLLLNCLGYEVKNTLNFACREKSNYTLQNIQELLQMNSSNFDLERIEPGIQNGINIIMQEIHKFDNNESNNSCNKEQFCEKLSRVVIYRIEVPENTDLNRYFEIMNTRGEQLEQHDILKAKLMGYLTDEEDKAIFAKIWDACSDMTGYVQMHFTSKNNEVRKAIFGDDWNTIPSLDWSCYPENIQEDLSNGEGKTIKNIIEPNFTVDMNDGYLDDDTRVRFESIIDFPYFLLHTLKVYVAINNISLDGKEIALDDKKLLESFGHYDSRDSFSRNFIVCLLRTRYLFDKYIIKREYANESASGEWSLKSLKILKSKKTSNNNKGKPQYSNTYSAVKDENDQKNKQILMLQSALRVSYTSPKAMHWITDLLILLYGENNKANNTDAMESHWSKFNGKIEDIAKKAVNADFLGLGNGDVYAMGVGTPHIVFNYLDYLLWKKEPQKYADFTFEFRNSVEHWYPQNPSGGTFESWKDGVDRFGNLCIIQRNVNSKFSNMSPEAKKSTFKEMISKGSIKLRIMSELTEKGDGKTASLYWKDTKCEEHEKNMIKMLHEACCQGKG